MSTGVYEANINGIGSQGSRPGPIGALKVRVARFQVAVTLGDALVWENPGTVAAPNTWDVIQPITANFQLFAGVAYATYAAGAFGLVVEEGFYDVRTKGDGSAIAAWEMLGPLNATFTMHDTALTNGTGVISTAASVAADAVIRGYVLGIFRNAGSLTPGV